MKVKYYFKKKFYFLIKNWTFPKFTINSKRNQRFKGKQLNPQLHFIVKISTKYHPWIYQWRLLFKQIFIIKFSKMPNRNNIVFNLIKFIINKVHKLTNNSMKIWSLISPDNILKINWMKSIEIIWKILREIILSNKWIRFKKIRKNSKKIFQKFWEKINKNLYLRRFKR